MPYSSSSKLLSNTFWRGLRKVLPGSTWGLLYGIRERLLAGRYIRELSGGRDAEAAKVSPAQSEIMSRLLELWHEFGAVGKGRSGYARHYAQVLDSPPLEGFRNVLEIGVFGGGSHRAWRKMLPGADIWGFDIDPATVIDEERIHTFLGDQLDDDSLHSLKKHFPPTFDLIVDDGWHQPEAGIKSLKHFLPMLSPGGYYIVEDIDWKKYRGVWRKVQSLLGASFFTSLVEVDSDGSPGGIRGNYGMFLVRRKTNH